MHQKHPRLLHPTLGRYARAEFSFVGTTCARMDGLMETLRAALPDFRVLTVIGDHGAPRDPAFFQVGSKQFTGGPVRWNDYDDRLAGRRADLALVNGNHYPAARQIVFVDPNKAGTLERRREQLTDVAAIVMCPGATDLPDFLEGARPRAVPELAERVRCTLEEAGEALLPLLSTAATDAIPTVKALILAGGKSSRMGTDKGQLKYRTDQTELQRMVALTQGLGLETYLSLAADAVAPPVDVTSVIRDRFLGMGPLGAISSAFLTEPDTAWLVLACDLPLLDAGTVADLLAAREVRRVATAIRIAEQPFPEPLAALYEPRAYPRLLEFLSLGYACPRKMLINSDVAHHVLADGTPLTNANTPEQRAAVLAALGEA